MTEDGADELLEIVAVLSDPAERDRRETYRSFMDRVASLGKIADSL